MNDDNTPSFSMYLVDIKVAYTQTDGHTNQHSSMIQSYLPANKKRQQQNQFGVYWITIIVQFWLIHVFTDKFHQ